MKRPTKVSSAEVMPSRRQGGEIRILLSPNSVGSTSGFMGTLELAPNDRINEHYHPYSEKFIYVVRGSLIVQTDAGNEEVGADEAVMIGPETRHRIVNGSVPTLAVLHLGPLAPRPDLGHVETEEVARPDEPHPAVGGP